MQEVLCAKHLEARPLQDGVLPLDKCLVEDPHLVISEQITASVIKSTTLKTTGSAGPSHVDACEWRICCSSFHRLLTDFCDALACAARCLCSSLLTHWGCQVWLPAGCVDLGQMSGSEADWSWGS